MSLVPQSDLNILEIDEDVMPSKTYNIDFENKRVVGFVDGKKAIEQSVYLALKTLRYEFLIYSWNYGEELTFLFGKDKELAKVEVPRLVKECLLVDDRVEDVVNFIFSDTDDGLEVTFEVITVEGNIDIGIEVRL